MISSRKVNGHNINKLRNNFSIKIFYNFLQIRKGIETFLILGISDYYFTFLIIFFLIKNNQFSTVNKINIFLFKKFVIKRFICFMSSFKEKVYKFSIRII